MITSNVEVGQGGGKDVSAEDGALVRRARVLAAAGARLPVADRRPRGLLRPDTSPENIDTAVREFANPDVESPQKATAVALGEKVKQKVPPPRETTVHRPQRQRRRGLGLDRELPPRAARLPDADARRTASPRTRRPSTSSAPRSTSTPARPARKPAARKLANLFGSADVKKLTPTIRALGNDAMVVAVVGQTFHGRLAVGAGRPDAEAPAGERRLRRERGRRPAAPAPPRDRLPADGADEDRALVVDRPTTRRSASTRSTRTRSTRPSASRTSTATTSTGASR